MLKPLSSKTVNSQCVPVLSVYEAVTQGFTPLTTYFLRSEDNLLSSCVGNLQAGGINFCLVDTHKGVEVWRTLKGYKKGDH